ncbi:hypothetical protein GINT2_000058 [Glugoides intestinalis]
MNKQLEKICKMNDFEEVYKILESKTVKPSLIYKDMSLTMIDFNYLKNYTLESILKLLNADKRIPNSLLQLTGILDQDLEKSAKATVCNFIISRNVADLSQFIQAHFQDPSALKKIFGFLEATVDKISDLYSNLPAEWNIDLLLVNRSLIMIKQVLCEYFFTNEIEGEIYSLGLVYTVEFEKKLSVFFSTKKCCFKGIEDNKNIEQESSNGMCIHKRMLSNVFKPQIETFIEHNIQKVIKKPFNQKAVNKNIVSAYVDYFQRLEYLYGILLYFDDSSVFLKLVHIADQKLLFLVQKTDFEDKVERMVVLMSTILFVQQVFEEFLNNITSKYHVDFQSTAIEASRKLERLQVLRIEKEFNKNFTGKIDDFENSYNAFLNSTQLVPDSVKIYILEICMARLFSKISSVKMNPQVAKSLFEAVHSLEARLKLQVDIVPHSKLMYDYLTIFLISPENAEEFIANFKSISFGRFDFIQILKSLQDQKQAMKLYEAYKKLLK